VRRIGPFAAGERGSTLVEFLVAIALGLVVVGGGVQLLRTYAAMALQVQADLGATSGAGWALRTALRDVKRAGADPLRSGVAALGAASPHAITLQRDDDADGAIDPNSQESVGLRWSDGQGGRVSRSVGSQSMAIVAGVPRGGLRLRYFDGEGREIPATGGLGVTALDRVRRVEVAIDVTERMGTVSGKASLTSAASVRVREGAP